MAVIATKKFLNQDDALIAMNDIVDKAADPVDGVTFAVVNNYMTIESRDYNSLDDLFDVLGVEERDSWKSVSGSTYSAMSLTSHFRDTKSDISVFMREMFPHIRPIQTEVRLALKAANILRPDSEVPVNTIGTALDYRLRYYFALTEPSKLIAYRGAFQFAKDKELPAKLRIKEGLVVKFFDALTKELQKINPVNRRLSEDEERQLSRYCIVLACFEQINRAGIWIDTPLHNSKLKTIEDLLAIAEDEWIDDLCQQSQGFYDNHSSLVSSCSSFELNPTFAGSRDVGADADLIVDHCLLEFKSTVKDSLPNVWLYQLIAYALLDYDDEFEIREIGFYFARQQVLIKWNLPQLIEQISMGLLTLDASRERFRKLFH